MKKIIAWTLVILSLVSLLACTASEQSAIVTPEPDCRSVRMENRGIARADGGNARNL